MHAATLANYTQRCTVLLLTLAGLNILSGSAGFFSFKQ